MSLLAPQPLSDRLQALLQPELGTSARSSTSDTGSRRNAHASTSSLGSGQHSPARNGSPVPPKKRLRTTRGAVPVITRPLASPIEALHSESVDATQIASTSTSIPRQRPSIKVRIITWNMHDSLPKGDLEVLLGKAGKYVAPQSGWDVSVNSDEEGEEDTHSGSPSNDPQRRSPFVVGQEKVPRADRIPPLPHDDSHPYHLLVIAGQECPWGDGKRLATSVGMAGELGDIGKQKTRSAKEKARAAKDASSKLASAASPTPTAEDGGLGGGIASAATSSTRDANDEDSFPFQSPPMTQAISGFPLPSPYIGGSQMAGLGAPTTAVDEDKLAGGAWPAIGGKGWSDLCEDWLCKNQTSKKDKAMSGGARLARALSTSSKMVASRESLVDPQSRSAVVTPELSRAASPVGFMLSASAPGTPNQSTYEGLASFADATSPSSSDLYHGTPGGGNDKRKRLVPKLNLKHVDLVRKHSSASRAHGEEGPWQSPVVDSPAVFSPSPVVEQPPGLATSTSSGGLLSVPTVPSMHRMGSSNSLSSLAKAGSSVASSIGLGSDLQVQPPSPSRSPSPCPDDGRLSAAPTKSAIAGEKVAQDGTPKSLGPYELVIKERMMGCYMAVYVWRGCKDRVRGASRSHVKSGLLAGRLGNKGGVGISVKLGTTRLLFVNAHLAAHEDKVALRLANVARIKAALKVDSFLPNTDPRYRLEDITEQFDHCFWFGDLNFRIDISRQHADWLLMHKKYDQALAFDQLGKVLNQGDAFKGFAEAPIHFPPTYKYDVLKTLRIKRSKTLTSSKGPIDIPNSGIKPASSDLALRRLAGGIIPEECDSHTDPDDAECTATCATALAASMETDKNMLSSSDVEGDMLVSGLTPKKLSRAERHARYKLNKAANADAMDGEASDEDQLSVSSSAFDSVGSSSSFAASYALHENRFSQQATTEAGRARERELENQRVLHENTAAAQGPKLFSQGAAIKAKFKLLGIVRTAASVNLKDKLSTATDADEPGAGTGVKKWLGVRTDSPRQPANADDPSEVLPSTPTSPSISRTAIPTDDLTANLDGTASSAEEDNAGIQRSESRAKRTTFKIEKAQRDAKYPHLTGATAEQIDFLEAQPYDTSAKQRVPSWCDRVLFRSTVPPDPDDSDADEDTQKRPSQIDARRSSKVGSVLSSALITPLRHAAERRHHMHAQRNASNASQGEAAPVTHARQSSDSREAVETSPVHLQPPIRAHTSPSLETASSSSTREVVTSPVIVAAQPGTAAHPPEKSKAPHLLQRFLHPGKRRNHAKALSPSLTVSNLTSPTTSTGLWTHHTNGSAEVVSSGAQQVRGLGLAGLDPKALSSVDLPSQLEERERAFDGAKAQVAIRSPKLEDRQIVIPPRMSSSGASATSLASKPPLPRSVSADSPNRAPESGTPPLATTTRTPPTSNPASQTSSWMDSISSHLPSFLVPAMSALRPFHHLNSAPHSDTDSDDAAKPHQQRSPREHLLGPKKGQIECLLYKSLDDREMRLLEGRSDHRPVIFVGAIGI